jgi:putative sigma-54 modulation protein
MTQIIIKTHHVEITDSIRKYVEEKLHKLDHFFDKIEEVCVDLDIEQYPNQDDRQIASATVRVPGNTLIAKAATKDLYASVDGMLDKLQRQLTKHKEKIRLKHRQEAKKTKRQIQTVSIDHSENGAHTSKTATEPYVRRPIFAEDAAVLLEDSDFSFLVFRNAEDQKINVMYVNDQGNFDLIET